MDGGTENQGKFEMCAICIVKCSLSKQDASKLLMVFLDLILS